MAEIREGAEIKPEMDLQELINKDGKGLCALILDPKDRRPGVQPYQGMVSLESNSVAENLENYMAKSEQLEIQTLPCSRLQEVGRPCYSEDAVCRRQCQRNFRPGCLGQNHAAGSYRY